MKPFQYLILIFFASVISSCQVNKKMVGLWQIEKVTMGDQQMTPSAKWMRINDDYTQESGNGWKQHSVGTWQYNKKTKTVKVISKNGVIDEFGGFTVSNLNRKTMEWSRIEEGQPLKVYLSKINKLPTAEFDQLLGVWELESSDEEASLHQSPYLFIRWDNIVVDRQLAQDRIYGMYKTHGHKKELQIIYYGDPLQQVIWQYNFTDDGRLVLEGNQDEKSIRKVYLRINEIPKD